MCSTGITDWDQNINRKIGALRLVIIVPLFLTALKRRRNPQEPARYC